MNPLWQSFLDTRIRIFDGDGGTEITIGAPAGPGVVAEREPVHVLTAWNPRGRQAPPEDNDARHAELLAALDGAGLVWVPAIGVAEDGGWAEAGVAITGLDLTAARELGRRFAQEALYQWSPQASVVAVVACFDQRHLLHRATAGALASEVRAGPPSPSGPGAPHDTRRRGR